MRVIIKIKSNVPKIGFRELILSNFKDDWQLPTNEIDLVHNLIGRVYSNYREPISKMLNYSLEHRTLENCYMLISILSEDIEIRIFYDHIASLRELSGTFLKSFERFIIKPHKYTFKHQGNVIISEAHNNNILDEGVVALKVKDYFDKTVNDRRSEFLLFCFISFLSIITLVITISYFKSPRNVTLIYELASKCIAPFLASAILTGMNLLVYFWRLRANTNILWGHQYNY